jgi:hypothetical protein
MSEYTNSFQQYQQIIDRIEAAVSDESDRRWHELQQDIFDRRLLKLQRHYYNENPCEERRGFIFWYGDGTTYADYRRGESLDRMCEYGWFVKVQRPGYEYYRITDAGLKA